MGKKLSEMTLEELWQLFPIFLTAPQPEWQTWYREEERLLNDVLPSVQRISHIGSTAIPSIWAKPIIDILVEIPRDCSLSDCKALICKAGYICMSQGEKRLSFNKGYTEQGFAERVFHLHLRVADDHDELYFRDYLIEFPEIAKEYETMKLALWKVHEHDRDAYTNAKTAFVKHRTEAAKERYGNRYKAINGEV